MLNAYKLYNNSFNDGLMPDENISFISWSNTHRYLPKVSTKEHGRYSTKRTPYVEEIMECLSPASNVKEVCFMKSAQIGGTEIGICWFGFIVDVTPGPALFVYPTVDLARDFSRQKLQPSIAAMPKLRKKIKESKSRDGGNTILSKSFPGGICFLAGSNSPVGFRSRSIRFLFLDDVDGYEADVGGEGDPVDLAKKRTNTYSGNKKIFEVSTPTIKSISRIEKSFLESDQRYYFVPCPFCEQKQRLIWDNIKFSRSDGKIKKIWYECEYCKKEIEESHKTKMLANGKWIPQNPGAVKRGYQLSALYSPLGWVSWHEIATEFLEVHKNPERLKTWVNTVLGEPFESAGDQPDWAILKGRAEHYNINTVPKNAYILSAGVDVQDDRLAIVIVGWGKNEEAWIIYHAEIYGDIGKNDVWDKLDNVINRQYDHETGNKLQISSVAIDSGGHYTQDVYNYCRIRYPKVIAIKGSSQTGKPVIGRPSQQDVTYMGSRINGGVQLWSVGTDTAKNTIYSRLRITQPGAGYIHFPIALQDDFYLQLTAEKIITRYVKGYPKLEWQKIRENNEVLDCFVYAYAAALRAELWSIDFDKLAEEFSNEKTHKEILQQQVKMKRKENTWLKRGTKWL